MKFSVIIPVYKVEDYLPSCIESVLSQTFQDYEVILVDDGSPDRCPEMCDEIARKDTRFSVIHKENAGLSSARNAGLDVAKGEYIYFLDSDDTIDSRLLEITARKMDQGYDMVAFCYQYLRGEEIQEKGREIETGEFCLKKPAQKLDFLSRNLVLSKIGWDAWSRVFRRDKIQKYGLRFEDNRRIFAEDLYFSLCYLAHAEKILCLDDCLYHYRIREDSIMGVQQHRSNLGRIHTLSEAVLSYYRRFDDCVILAEHFDDIYYHLIAGQFMYQLWASHMKPSAFREMVQEEVTDWEGMAQRLREYPGCKKFSLEEAELKTHVRFLLGGSEFMLRLQCRILRSLFKRRKVEKNG